MTHSPTLWGNSSMVESQTLNLSDLGSSPNYPTTFMIVFMFCSSFQGKRPPQCGRFSFSTEKNKCSRPVKSYIQPVFRRPARRRTGRVSPIGTHMENFSSKAEPSHMRAKFPKSWGPIGAHFFLTYAQEKIQKLSCLADRFSKNFQKRGNCKCHS